MTERISTAPVDAMDTHACLNLIESLHFEYGLSFPQSLILLQVGIRLGQIPLQKYIFETREGANREFGQNSEAFKRLIETDLKRDLKRLQKEDPAVTLESLKRDHYTIGRLINLTFTAYTQVHIYKALSLMSNYPAFFAFAAPWCSHDPLFVLPAFVMALNYSLLENSRHPFLINVRQNWSPFTKALAVLYGSGMALVLP